MSLLPDFLTNRAVFTQILGLAAVHYMTKRSVRERTANLTLTPPLLTDEDKEKAKTSSSSTTPAEATPTIRRPWYRRVFSKKTAMATVPMLVIGTMQFFVIWVLPRISSALVLDVFWASLCGWIISQVMYSLLVVFLAGQPAIRLIRGSDNKLHLKHESADPNFEWGMFKTKRNVRIASTILPAAFVGLTYYDDKSYLVPVMATGWIIHMFASIVFPRISVRVMTKVTLGFLFSCGAVFGIVAVLASIWPSHFDPKQAPKAGKLNMAQPDQWVLTLMMLPSDIIASVPIAFLVSLTMRYDHFHPTSSPSLTLGPSKTTSPGEIVPIPRTVESRPTPLYNIAMLAFAACHLVSDGLTAYLYEIKVLSTKPAGNERVEKEAMCKHGSFVLANLLVPAAIAAAAWCRGELSEWWGYHEEWVPKEEDDSIEQSEINDAEKALDPAPFTEPEASYLSSNDEKKPLPLA